MNNFDSRSGHPIYYDQEVGDKLILLDSELHFQVRKLLTVGRIYECIKRERTFTGYQYHIKNDLGVISVYEDWRFKNITKERDNRLEQLLNQ